MKTPAIRVTSLITVCVLMAACNPDSGNPEDADTAPATVAPTETAPTDNSNESGDNEAGGTKPDSPTTTDIVPANLYDYAGQQVPFYIQSDNTAVNSISNAGATLGRVLFYDTRLSFNDSVSCASCHQQELAFGDSAIVSVGANADTARHSMRLVNARFSDEARFFWDERAATLEQQTTQPIRDQAEMGFSGLQGAPSFDDLLVKLSDTDFYPSLFTQAFGNSVITEQRMQTAMAQFIRSIQSFDSRYDQGRASTANDRLSFANFTAEENEGKRLFIENAQFNATTGERLAGSGLGCQLCHRAPEFSIDNNSRNNGVITVAERPLQQDMTITRSATLRDLFSPDGVQHGPYMHDGSLASFEDVLDHYNDINADRRVNTNLDQRLNGSGGTANGALGASGQKLLLTQTERSAVLAFMKTLSGTNLYTDPRWSDPFNKDGSLDLSKLSSE